jgi:hypothetical protein
MSLGASTRPKAPEALVRGILESAGLLAAGEPCALLGVRAYYRDTVGQAGTNDVGTYDDAMFFAGPGVFLAVNANTDPGRLGFNPGVGKNFAMLTPGRWYFIRGPHKGRSPALRQATAEEAAQAGIPDRGRFTVWRAESMAQILAGGAPKETAYQAINIHRGGDATTSSWGCQTIPPGQFDDFMRSVWEHTKKHGMPRVPYLLVDGPLI